MATENPHTGANKPVRKKAATTQTATKKKTVARKKTAATKRPPGQQEKAAPAKKVVAKKAPPPSAESVANAVRNVYTREQRHKMIATMAYFPAEKRGFTPGKSDEDWLESERIIDDLLKKQGIKLGD